MRAKRPDIIVAEWRRRFGDKLAGFSATQRGIVPRWRETPTDAETADAEAIATRAFVAMPSHDVTMEQVEAFREMERKAQDVAELDTDRKLLAMAKAAVELGRGATDDEVRELAKTKLTDAPGRLRGQPQ